MAGSKKKTRVRLTGLYEGTAVENNGYGKSGRYVFVNIVDEEGCLVSKRYLFGALASIKKQKPRKGELFSFEAEVRREHFSVDILRPTKVQRVESPIDQEYFQYVASKFLKKSITLTKSEAEKNLFFLTRLHLEHGLNIDFWKHVDIGFELNSLAWFLTPDGNKVIMESLSASTKTKGLTLKPREAEPLEDKAVGERVEVKRKTRTLMDFLQ